MGTPIPCDKPTFMELSWGYVRDVLIQLYGQLESRHLFCWCIAFMSITHVLWVILVFNPLLKLSAFELNFVIQFLYNCNCTGNNHCDTKGWVACQDNSSDVCQYSPACACIWNNTQMLQRFKKAWDIFFMHLWITFTSVNCICKLMI